jgi:PAS domain S-box-containing protein
MQQNPLADRWLFDQIAQGMLLLDRDRRILAINRNAQEFFGVTEEEARGKQCWDITSFALCAEQCSFREVLQTGEGRKTLGFDCLLGRKYSSVCVNLTPLRDSQGEIVAVMECFQDASLMKDLAERLQE